MCHKAPPDLHSGDPISLFASATDTLLMVDEVNQHVHAQDVSLRNEDQERDPRALFKIFTRESLLVAGEENANAVVSVTQ